jgi:hypothetical protein
MLVFEQDFALEDRTFLPRLLGGFLPFVGFFSPTIAGLTPTCMRCIACLLGVPSLTVGSIFHDRNTEGRLMAVTLLVARLPNHELYHTPLNGLKGI